MAISDDTATINSSITLVNPIDAPVHSSEERYEARERHRKLKLAAYFASQEANRAKLLAWSSSSAKEKYVAAEEEAARLRDETAQAEATMHAMHERPEVDRLPGRQRAGTDSQGGVAATLFAALGGIASSFSF